MKKLTTFYSVINAILLGSLLIVYNELKDMIVSDENIILSKMFIAINLIIIFEIIKLILKSIIENTKWIKKLILGDDYVEGIWINQTVRKDDAIFYSIMTLKLVNNQIVSSGIRYSEDGKPQLSWRTVSSHYNSNSVKLLYKSTFFSNDVTGEFLGMAIYDFTVSNFGYLSSPKTMKGSIYPISSPSEPLSFIGYKVTDKKMIKDLNDPKKLQSTFKKLIDLPYFNLN